MAEESQSLLLFPGHIRELARQFHRLRFGFSEFELRVASGCGLSGFALFRFRFPGSDASLKTVVLGFHFVSCFHVKQG